MREGNQVKPVIVGDVKSTPGFQFLSGSFQLSNWHIPYLTTTMDMASAADHLNLATEMPGAETVDWELNELYQRDIDWTRVERQIVPFLANKAHPQFFNSLTVALLPFSPGSAALSADFNSGSWHPPSLSKPSRFEKVMNVGPISVGFWSDWTSPLDPGFQLGELAWNPEEVFAVAIDGQHRLAAAKSLRKGSTAITALRETRIPVILLIFDPSLGYQAAEPRPTVTVLRNLFIDLNKHAQTVNRARQILLDDRDVHSICVRRLLATRMSDHLNELSLDPPRLPLSLVDWYSEQGKFDEGPCLTTVLGLDWIVSKVLATNPIKDFMDYPAVRRHIDQIRKSLGIDLNLALQRLEEAETSEQTPFSFTDDELSMIEDAFADVWGAPLVHLLSQFAPWQALIDRRVERNTTTLDFQNWYRLYRRMLSDRFAGRATDEYRQLLGRITQRPQSNWNETKLRQELEQIHTLKFDNLGFNVAFQRAVVDAMLEYCKITDDQLDEVSEAFEEGDAEGPYFGSDSEWDSGDDASGLGDLDGEDSDESEDADATAENEIKERTIRRADEFIKHLNDVVDDLPEVLNISAPLGPSSNRTGYLWQGTLRKAEGTIDFTAGASTRAKDLIFMAVAMRAVRERGGLDNDGFETAWDMVLEDGGTSVCRRINRAVVRFTKDDQSAAGRVLLSRDDAFDPDDALDECRVRLEALWCGEPL